MTSSERRVMIEKIRRLPQILEAAVKGLNDAQLDTPYRAGSWTVRQVVHHIADSHMNGFIRLKLALTEDHPTLKPYDQDRWAVLVDSARLPPEHSLAIVRGLHHRWSTLLDSISEADWGRTAYHPEDGEMTVETFLTVYADHGEKHVDSISSLRKQKGW